MNAILYCNVSPVNVLQSLKQYSLYVFFLKFNSSLYRISDIFKKKNFCRLLYAYLSSFLSLPYQLPSHLE